MSAEERPCRKTGHTLCSSCLMLCRDAVSNGQPSTKLDESFLHPALDCESPECLGCLTRPNVNPLLVGVSSDSSVGGMCSGGDESGKCRAECVGCD